MNSSSLKNKQGSLLKKLLVSPGILVMTIVLMAVIKLTGLLEMLGINEHDTLHYVGGSMYESDYTYEYGFSRAAYMVIYFVFGIGLLAGIAGTLIWFPPKKADT